MISEERKTESQGVEPNEEAKELELKVEKA